MAGLPLRSVPRWLPGLAVPISNCWVEQRLGEQLSVRRQIVKFHSTSHEKTCGQCIRYL